ncbi:MAG: putative RNA polymerase [Prokaryotic dsDNA virus sp.]|nr:MAG: putative RNA polymerase [Prokaryotic dsDNA virus sp.]
MTFQRFTGREYLMIDIANNFGADQDGPLDKQTWDQRIAWFRANQHQLETLVQVAEEPALFYAGVQAWRAVERGEPIGYMISLDATSSGLQLLAALTCDARASSMCNVINIEDKDGNITRMDAYTAIYERMLQEIDDTAKIERDPVKAAVMTAFYGSKAMPKKVFGEGALLDTFYKVLNENAPAAWELNEAFMAMWDPEASENAWVLPDNFHVKVKVMAPVKETVHFANMPHDVFYNVNMPTESGRSLGANVVHSVDGMIVRELTRRCDYNRRKIVQLTQLLEQPALWGDSTEGDDDRMVLTLWQRYQDTGYLSARILDHLYPQNIGHVDAEAIRSLIRSLPEKPFKLVSVHDCFRCLPHYGDDLRLQYNLQLKLIAESNLLGNLISQIIGQPITIGKLDPNMITQIMDSEYALS